MLKPAKIYQLTGEKDFSVLLHFGQNLTSNLEKICNTPCLNQNNPAVEVALNAVTENYPQIITEDGAVRFICEHARPVIRGLGYCYCPQDRCLKTPQQFPPLTSLNDLIRRSYPERYPQPRPKPFASATRKRYGRA